MNRELARFAAPLRHRVANLLARAVVRLIDDGKKLQELQIEAMKGEIRGKCEHFQPYGFYAVPLEGSEAVVAFLNGQREHPIVLAAVDRRYRPRDGKPGEAGIYNHEGDYVIVKDGRIVEVKAGTKLRVDAPEAEFTGNVTIAGDLQVDGTIHSDTDVVADTISGKTHIHGGVQTGAGTTGAPQ